MQNSLGSYGKQLIIKRGGRKKKEGREGGRKVGRKKGRKERK